MALWKIFGEVLTDLLKSGFEYITSTLPPRLDFAWRRAQNHKSLSPTMSKPKWNYLFISVNHFAKLEPWLMCTHQIAFFTPFFVNSQCSGFGSVVTLQFSKILPALKDTPFMAVFPKLAPSVFEIWRLEWKVSVLYTVRWWVFLQCNNFKLKVNAF